MRNELRKGRKDWVKNGKRRWITTNFLRHGVVNYAKSLTSIFRFQLKHWKNFFFIIKKRNFHRKRHFKLCHFVNFTYIHSFCTSHEVLDIKIESKYVSNRNDKWENRNRAHSDKKFFIFCHCNWNSSCGTCFRGEWERKHHFETILCDVEQNLHTNRLSFTYRKLVCIFLCTFFRTLSFAAYLPSSERETIQIWAMLREYFTQKKRFILLILSFVKIKLELNPLIAHLWELFRYLRHSQFDVEYGLIWTQNILWVWERHAASENV